MAFRTIFLALAIPSCNEAWLEFASPDPHARLRHQWLVALDRASSFSREVATASDGISLSMIPIETIDDIALLKETVELECKLAAGKNGKGQLPADFWPTYSAFANSHGGTVILGLREKSGSFEIAGIEDIDRVRSEIFAQLNNRQKVSVNLIKDDQVRTVEVNGRSLIVIEVPQAGRREKPVYLGGNPMTGTYRRLNEGDCVCDGDTVKRLLAEQTEDSRDNRVLRNFGLSDLDVDTIRAYRQAMRDRSANHPFLDEDDVGFLKCIGAVRIDREHGYEGLTIAGLLMFGRGRNIQDEFPNYFLDYQERAAARTESRWIDRITLDGTWSGNLYDFYRRVYRKLVSELKVPFALQDGVRLEETPVHESLREALVNAIVHADYTGRVSLLIVKRPDMFGFRNPGLMRVPVEQAIKGGESDGRNRTLQSMFLLVGAGERAGSGVPKIHKGWAEQHWRAPSLYEKETPSEQTLLELRMIDLIPGEALEFLREMFGRLLDDLSAEQRLVLAMAATEQYVTHARLMPVCNLHPADLTRLLQGLVQVGYLEKSGRSRGAVYGLPGASLPDPNAVFGPPAQATDSMVLIGKGAELLPKGTEFRSKGPNLSSEPLTPYHGRIVEGLPRPVVDNLNELDDALRDALEAMSIPVNRAGKVSAITSQNTILDLCDTRYLTIRVLAELLHRDEDYLRQRILNPMVEDGLLERAFPQSPNDPRQAYTSAQDKKSD